MGRPSKPVAQKRREGNPGKRKLPRSRRRPLPAVRVEPLLQPLFPLEGEALQLWVEVTERLAQVGMLAAIDQPALYVMCVEWGLAAAALRAVAEQGLFALGSTGQVIEHPAVRLLQRSHLIFLRFAEQYAMTPASRARVTAALTPPVVRDELADIVDAEPELRTTYYAED